MVKEFQKTVKYDSTYLEIVEKSGAWYSYKGEKIGQGRENSKNYLKTHQDVFEEISNRIRAKISGEEIQKKYEKKQLKQIKKMKLSIHFSIPLLQKVRE